MGDSLKRVLLAGNDGSGPGPSLGAGACIARTGCFRQALELGGFAVEICSPGSTLSSITDVRRFLEKGGWSSVVAISPHPAELTVMAGTSLPLWVEMNGMHPAEAHLSGDEQGEPRLEMLRMLSLENTLLSRGDHFSAPSVRQAHAILGELYLLGRLDSADRNVIPVSAIQHCALDAPVSRGLTDPADPFPIISTGSFNSWFDGETLFRGLEYAMDRNDQITFTCTGGSVPFSESQYSRFQEMVSGSPHRSRFKLAGWVDREELERIQSGAGAAVYTDITCCESLLGARTRALDWISRGIPVVCTDGAEISDTIRDRGLGLTVPQGDHKALGDAFMRLASEPETVAGIRKAQEDWRRGEGHILSVFRPLLDWCAHPSRLSSGQLCDPTVARVSSPEYRSSVIREIARKKGFGGAAGFMIRSAVAKLRRRDG